METETEKRDGEEQECVRECQREGGRKGERESEDTDVQTYTVALWNFTFVLAVTSAPFSSKKRTVSTMPASAAMWSADTPSWLRRGIKRSSAVHKTLHALGH